MAFGFKSPPSRPPGGSRNIRRPRNTLKPSTVRPFRPGTGSQPHPPRQSRGGLGVWSVVITLVLLVAVLVFCYVYRDAITKFLAQILSWVIVLFIIFLVLRGIIKGGRRR